MDDDNKNRQESVTILRTADDEADDDPSFVSSSTGRNKGKVNGGNDDGNDNGNTNVDVNPYLALRAAKIARNEARLKELGLWKQQQEQPKKIRSSPLSSSSSSSSKSGTKKRKAKQQRWDADSSELDQKQQYQNLRRSSRVKKTQPNYVEDKISLTSSSSLSSSTSNSFPSIETQRTSKRLVLSTSESTRSETFGDDADVSTTTTNNMPYDGRTVPRRVSTNSGTTTSKVKPNSVRLIRLDHTKLVKAVLGQNLQKTGKDFVIHHSFKIAAYVEDQTRLGYYNNKENDHDDKDAQQQKQDSVNGNSNIKHNPIPRLSFNKYSGVQEWYSNNTIFLWVNLNNNKSSSGRGFVAANDFLNDGRQITWFGGSRMYDGSPIIESLIKIGKNAQRIADAADAPSPLPTTETAETNKTDSTQSSSSSSSSASSVADGAIILWCRRYVQETKAFSPYYCFGRLGYCSHVVGSHPLSFVWNLLDYDQLLYRGGQDVRDMMMLR